MISPPSLASNEDENSTVGTLAASTCGRWWWTDDDQPHWGCFEWKFGNLSFAQISLKLCKRSSTGGARNVFSWRYFTFPLPLYFPFLLPLNICPIPTAFDIFHNSHLSAFIFKFPFMLTAIYKRSFSSPDSLHHAMPRLCLQMSS